MLEYRMAQKSAGGGSDADRLGTADPAGTRFRAEKAAVHSAPLPSRKRHPSGAAVWSKLNMTGN